MKQFEKYWKKHNPQKGILCDDFRRDRYVWQDALRWIYKEAKELQKHPEIPIDAFDLIEEELNEN